MTTKDHSFRFRHPYRFFPAVPIIAIGVLFLMSNLGVDLGWLRHHNAWALFLFIGAVPPLTLAYERWRRNGGFDAMVAYYLLGATAVALVAVMFLAELDWSVWWPLFIILGGLYSLVGNSRRCYRNGYDCRDDDHHDGATASH